MNNILIIYLAAFLYWFVIFIEVLKEEFTNNINKIVWIFLLIFLPFTSILFPFIGRGQTKWGENLKIGESIMIVIFFIFLSTVGHYILKYIGIFIDFDILQEWGAFIYGLLIVIVGLPTLLGLGKLITFFVDLIPNKK